MTEWAGLIALASGFVMLAGLMVGLIAWLRADMNRRMDRLETVVSEIRERVARLEVGQGELRGRMDRLENRMDRLEAGQGELRGRIDRIDGQLDALPGAVGRAVAEAIGKPRTRRARFEPASRRTAIR